MSWVIALGGGLALGAASLLGLWWTVQLGLRAASPALWFAASALLRLGMLLAGLSHALSSGWLNLALMFGGILIARSWVTHRTLREPAPPCA